MADLRSTTAVLGITSTLVLAGLNIGTSLLFIPRMYTLPLSTSTTIFDKLYHNGAKVVVPLALAGIASLSYLSCSSPASHHGGRAALGVAAGLVVGTLGWTNFVVMPVNEELISMAHDAHRRERAGPKRVEKLLRTWKWMNYVRGFVALGAGVLALTAMV